MVAAGYCMYGSMTYLMLTMGDKVSGFTLDTALGELINQGFTGGLGACLGPLWQVGRWEAMRRKGDHPGLSTG